MKRPLRAVVTVIAVSAAALPLGIAPAARGAELPALTIAPAGFEGIAVPGQDIGPIAIRNTTGRRYWINVLPVLVGQSPDGGLFVRADRSARARAGRLLRVSERASFSLPSGAVRSVSARLRARSPEDNFYGGLLFRGRPTRDAQQAQIVQVLELNGRIFLRPPISLSRTRAELSQLRGESNAHRHLRLFARVANKGNVDLRPAGTVQIRDLAGGLRFTGHLKSTDVLPGYAVDLHADLGDVVLAAGTYTLEANVQAAGKLLRKRTRVKLFGPNALATRRIRIASFEPPRAVDGKSVTVSVAYRNTGNVRFQPKVELLVSDRKEPISLDSERVSPGRKGNATGAVRLDGTRARNLTARLLVGGRRVETRTVSVTPVPRASVMQRASDWIVERAVALVFLLTALLIVALVAVARLVVVRS